MSAEMTLVYELHISNRVITKYINHLSNGTLNGTVYLLGMSSVHFKCHRKETKGIGVNIDELT